MSPKPMVRVTIKSDLPELQGKEEQKKLGLLDHVLVEPKTTWIELLQYHEIPVDVARHQIKSTRNNSYLDDQIQATALHYRRGVLRVQIVNLQNFRVRVSKLLKSKQTGASRTLNLTQKDPITSTPTSSRQAPLPPPSLTTSPITNGKSKPGLRVASCNREPTAETSGVNKYKNAPAPASKKRAAPQGVDQLHGEVNFNGATWDNMGQERQMPEDPIIGGPVGFILPAGYAESQASQDSQPDDPCFNDEKKTLLESFARARNEDFTEILREMQRLKKMDEYSRFRWQRKTPLLATLMFNWTERHIKK